MTGEELALRVMYSAFILIGIPTLLVVIPYVLMNAFNVKKERG